MVGVLAVVVVWVNRRLRMEASPNPSFMAMLRRRVVAVLTLVLTLMLALMPLRLLMVVVERLRGRAWKRGRVVVAARP